MIDRVVIIDPRLNHVLGHHYVYSSALVAAAQAIGLSAISFVNEQCDSQILAKVEGRRVFIDPLQPTFGKVGYGYAEEWVRMNHACLAQMDRIPRHEIRENDLFVIHSASPAEFFALGVWYARLAPPRPRIVVNFHQPPENYAGEPDRNVARSLFDRSAQPWREIDSQRVIIASTNHTLGRHISSISGIRAATYPNFVVTSDLRAYARPSERPVFFFSGFSHEKGLHHLVNIVISPNAKLDDLHLVLHVRRPMLHGRIKEMFSKNERRVEVLGGPLSRENYARILMEAGAILLPYSPRVYRMRCSGMFVEAMACGRPVVTTSGTTMSEDLITLGLPGVVADEWTAAGVYRAIRRLRAELNVRTDIAQSVGPSFGHRSTAATMLSSMLKDLSVQ